MTTLHDACFLSSTKMVEGLLVRGADVNTEDLKGNTPAHIASVLRMTEILKVLLAHGVDINVQNTKGRTPLNMACQKGV